MADPDPKAAAPQEPAADAPKADKAAKPKGGKLKAFMAGRTPRERIFLQATGLVIALVVVDLIVVRPVTSYLSRVDEMISIEEKVIPKRLMILKYKDKIVREYRSWKPLMSDPLITQEEEIAKLLREVERVSKESGLFVSNINPVKTTEKTSSIYELSVDIEGKGNIDAVRKFLRKIENDNAAIRIDAYTLKPQGKESDELKFSLTIIKIGVKEKQINVSV